MSSGRQAFRVFVGGLPWTISRHELKQYFSQFGHVKMATVSVNKETGWSRGYGFVNFSNRDAYIAATGRETHFIEGSEVTVTARNEPSNSPETRL